MWNPQQISVLDHHVMKEDDWVWYVIGGNGGSHILMILLGIRL